MIDRIQRLTAYRRSLERLKAAGVLRVTSGLLAEASGTSASVVRKDFSVFGLQGKRRGGYGISEVLEGISTILEGVSRQGVILVGCGNLGQALLRYAGFSRDGLAITAGFDTDPARINRRGKPPILPPGEMSRVISETGASIAIIAVPDFAAQETLDRLAELGIRGILNFAPVHLHAPAGTHVRNVNLEMELEGVAWLASLPAGAPDKEDA